MRWKRLGILLVKGELPLLQAESGDPKFLYSICLLWGIREEIALSESSIRLAWYQKPTLVAVMVGNELAGPVISAPK